MIKHSFKYISIIITFSTLLCSGTMAISQTQGGNDDNENYQPRVRYKTKKNQFRYNNILSIYPAQALNSCMMLGYEFRTGDRTAFKTIAGYTQKEGDFFQNGFQNVTMTNFSSYRIEMQIKYFINKKVEPFNGIYFSPFILYKASDFSYDIYEERYDPITGVYSSMTTNKKGKASALHAGFILGYHIKMGDNFTLDICGGEGIMNASGDYKNGSRVFDVYSNSIRLKAGLDFGFGF